MSKFGAYNVVYGTSEVGDIVTLKAFDHVNKSQNVLASASDPVDVYLTFVRLFGRNVARFAGIAGTTDAAICETFAAKANVNANTHVIHDDKAWTRKTAKACAVKVGDTWYKTDANHNIIYRATLAGLFAGFADGKCGTAGFHTSERLDRAIERGEKINRHVDIYMEMRPRKGGTSVSAKA